MSVTVFFFFFSSRRRHTRYWRDWSSDVCSSDLKAKEDFGREARLLREVGAEYLVHLPEQYTDMHGGALTESAEIDPEQLRRPVSGTDELARHLPGEFGVKLVIPPHGDTHVDNQARGGRCPSH